MHQEKNHTGCGLLTNNKVIWTASDTLTNTVALEGNTSNVENLLNKDITKYMNYILAIKQQNALLGKTDTKQKTLDEVLGASNIALSGYMSESFVLDPSMKKSSGASYNQTYHTASIDFSDL